MLTFRKGPIGTAILKDGKVVGDIKNRSPWGAVLRITGRTFPAPPESLAARMGFALIDGKVFPTMKAAQIAAKEILCKGLEYRS